ncbi:MAG TPA: ABC transporter ATP-binding protein [Acidimicrobiales bacterium]|nr:ABC transporter ATP-binding protein [Acidimicrobiales bacterium]
MAVVEVRDLVKRYRNRTVNAVDHVSFDVGDGELFCLLGPNGAGKTTTLSVLTTILRPTSGSVRIAGWDVVGHPGRVRGAVGIVFQGPSLDLNLTAEENLRLHAILYGLFPWRPSYRLMPAGYRRRVSELADILDVVDLARTPVRELSGGTRRKFEIVRALMHSPRVLFLDEPTTGLDPESRRSLWGYLRGVQAASGTTIVLTTHYLEEAEQADVVCVVDRGAVRELDSPANLKRRQLQPTLEDAYLRLLDGDAEGGDGAGDGAGDRGGGR